MSFNIILIVNSNFNVAECIYIVSYGNMRYENDIYLSDCSSLTARVDMC